MCHALPLNPRVFKDSSIVIDESREEEGGKPIYEKL